MRYCVVRGESHADLEIRVNALIAQGWRPHGGVSAMLKWERDGDGFLLEDWHYHQAMIDPADRPPPSGKPAGRIEEV